MHPIDELRDLALRHAAPGRVATEVPRLGLLRSDSATIPAPAFYQPVFCMAVQGSKRLMIGERELIYDSSRFLVVAVDMPVMACIVDATPDEPYLAFALGLDRMAIIDMLANLPSAPEMPDDGFGLVMGEADADLLDPVLRLMRLLDRTGDVAVLAPLAERELLYRLLTGPAGPVLRRMVTKDSRLARVDRVIDWIKRHFNKPMRIETLADIAGMSPASLHRHFKAVTALSPLQFQKQIRLQEARRRLVAEELDAGLVGYAVGYESQSQFTREYARLFGAPPSRDAARLRLGRPASMAGSSRRATETLTLSG